MSRVPLYLQLAETASARVDEFNEIGEERRTSLRELAGFIRRRVGSGQPVRLTFICTHNSRRSQMAQIWAQTAAAIFGISGVQAFSGGTEATTFNPRAVAALRRAGFQVDPGTDEHNRVYVVRFNDETDPVRTFSKVYHQPPNPTSDFAAVMTCSEADASCPLVRGACGRFAITYDDPKAFDGTDREAAAYDERSRQIAREMLFVFSQVGL